MDFKTFTDFGCSVFNHNYEHQKQLAQDDLIMTLGKLEEYIRQYPLAEIFLHYPDNEQAQHLKFCYTMGENPTQLLPVLSVYANDNKIVLSYLPSLEGVDFSDDLNMKSDYLNSVKLQQGLARRNRMFVEDHHMIFIEHISDDLNWKSDSEKNKIHQAFSFIGAHNYMLWSAYYFTPHY